MTAATPENLQNIFSDVNELAQNSLRQLGFDPEYYPWEMIAQVQAKIAEDWPDAQGHPYNTIPMNRLRDDLAAMDVLSTWTRILADLRNVAIPADAKTRLIDKKGLADGYWAAADWYEQHRLG